MMQGKLLRQEINLLFFIPSKIENYLEISLDIKVTKNAKLVEEINAQLSKGKTGFLVGNSASLAGQRLHKILNSNEQRLCCFRSSSIF